MEAHSGDENACDCCHSKSGVHKLCLDVPARHLAVTHNMNIMHAMHADPTTRRFTGNGKESHHLSACGSAPRLSGSKPKSPAKLQQACRLSPVCQPQLVYV